MGEVVAVVVVVVAVVVLTVVVVAVVVAVVVEVLAVEPHTSNMADNCSRFQCLLIFNGC